MLGESQNPRWDESKTSADRRHVALGIGLGSPLAGWLSGRKVELGLVPIGAVGMILGRGRRRRLHRPRVAGLVACIVLIGFFTGFYLVPLFTLLQHRAPKTSKGDVIATSNFINVTGADPGVGALLPRRALRSPRSAWPIRFKCRTTLLRGVLVSPSMQRRARPCEIVVDGDKPLTLPPANPDRSTLSN